MPVAAEPRRVGTVTLSANGRPVPAELYNMLLDTRVEQSTNAPDRFTLRFRDPHFALLDAAPPVFAIGTRVDIDIAVDGPETAVLTQGEVTSVVVEQSPTGRHELVVVGHDRRARLAGDHRVRVFAQYSNRQIVQDIARDHGLTVTGALAGPPQPYVLQVGTDYAMVDRCVTRAGAHWRVDGTELKILPSPAPLGANLHWGRELQRFRVRTSAAEWASEITVRSWDPVNQQAVVGSVNLASEVDTLPLGTDAPGIRQQFRDTARAYRHRRLTSAVPGCDRATADAIARWLADRTSRAFVTARGETIGDPTLRPGTCIDVDGVGTSLRGVWELATVEHAVAPDRPYVTRFTCGGGTPADIPDLLGDPAGVGNRHPTTTWGHSGVIVAVVTNVSDPDRLGRVKVAFPTLGDQVESTWARVAAPGAGKDQGFRIPYDPGDEVVVNFEHGELGGAVVLGGLWSPRNAPPPTVMEDGRATSDAWRSRGGHIIELLDAQAPKGQVSVRLRDEKTRLDLAEDRVALASPSPTTIESDQTITLRAKGQIVLDAATISLKGKVKVELQAPIIEARASAKASIEGATAELKGAGAATVQGGAVRVSGGTVSLG